MKTVPSEPTFRTRGHLTFAAAAGAVLVMGIGGWSVATKISGAVIGQGSLVVDGSVKKVQHPTGGVVGELFVKDGSKVEAGDLLLRLDDTQLKANLGIVTKNLDELAARDARDRAERDMASEVSLPEDLLARRGDPQVAAVIAGELRQFDLRRSARETQKKLLADEIAGLEVQRDSRAGQIEWVNKELKGVRHLQAQDLVPYTRLAALEREAVRLEGERGQLISSIAQAKGKIEQIDVEMRAEVGKDLGDIRGKQSEYTERKVAAEDQLRRVDLRAPRRGTVHQLAAHTVGGVVSPGEQIMLVVPDDEALVIEAKMRPEDVDQISVGQMASLKFAAANQRTTPEIDGTVVTVSPDITADPKTGISFYTVRVSASEAEIGKLGAMRLVAGMPVEVFVRTAERTPMSYLMRPLRDQIARAFSEK